MVSVLKRSNAAARRHLLEVVDGMPWCLNSGVSQHILSLNHLHKLIDGLNGNNNKTTCSLFEYVYVCQGIKHTIYN